MAVLTRTRAFFPLTARVLEHQGDPSGCASLCSCFLVSSVLLIYLFFLEFDFRQAIVEAESCNGATIPKIPISHNCSTFKFHCVIPHFIYGDESRNFSFESPTLSFISSKLHFVILPRERLSLMLRA